MAPDHPKKVWFRSLECCALCRAFFNTEHREYLLEMASLVGVDTINILGGIFQRTVNLGFIPNGIQRTLYSGIALRETTSLNQGDDTGLTCCHSKEEHLKALRNVRKTLNSNQAN